MHIHLLETIYQTEHARRRAGKTGPAHLKDLGFLGPDLTLGHAVWLTEADVEILAETRHARQGTELEAELRKLGFEVRA